MIAMETKNLSVLHFVGTCMRNKIKQGGHSPDNSWNSFYSWKTLGKIIFSLRHKRTHLDFSHNQ